MTICRYCKFSRMLLPEMGAEAADCIARIKYMIHPLSGMTVEVPYSVPLCKDKNTRGKCYDFVSADVEHEAGEPRRNLIKGFYYWLKWGSRVLLEEE